MADRTIGTLPNAAGVYDDTRIPVEQQGSAQSITGVQLKQYARESVAGTAREAADAAAKDATYLAAEYSKNAAASAATAREYGEAAVERSNAAIIAANQAQKTAADAVAMADNAGDDAAAARDAATEAQRMAELLGDDLAAKIDGAYTENGYLYLTSGDEVVAGPLGPFSGTGGGGGGGGNAGYLVTLKNLLDSRALTVSTGSVPLRILYTSVDEDGMDDGAGVGTVTVNGAVVATLSIPQGESEIDVGAYLVSGANTVKIKVENSEGNSRTISYNITVISLSITTSFDPLAVYTGAVVFNYTVTGSGTKTVRFLMDGKTLGTEEVASSGRSRSYAIPVQADGAHVLTVYAEVSVNGVTVRSNVLTIGMLWISASMTSAAVLTSFAQETATQGEILSIPYMVYDPLSETATVTLQVLSEDDRVYSSRTLTVGREPQVWTVQDYPAGEVIFRLACLNAIVDIVVDVAELILPVEPVTDALALHFDPTGRSNQEDNPAVWMDGNVAASFSGVGFTSADGWLTDEDGAAVFRILPGGEVTIPYRLFASDARASGATVEVEMATHNVRDYDTVVLSCLSGGRGFRIASQYAELQSEQSSISMQFKEDEKVRVSFVVEPRNINRLIYVYVDSILSGAVQYPANDNFAQNPPVGLTIGAESSGIDIYRIRLYTKGLKRSEILDNYISDRPLLPERQELAKSNDIFDLSEDIVLTKLPPTLPYMVIQCPELPQYKGDKKTCRIEYVNLGDSTRSFTAENVQIDVQGTSSAGYKKKNFKLKLKDFYQLRSDSIPAKVFCMKADVASSEGANNVELVRLYNDTVPYKTLPQQTDERVRVGIDGIPCVIFWQNTTTGENQFWGKYNFNFDKGAEAVFGLTAGCESWEIKNNTSDRVIFKSADFSGTAWQDDFEARYPEDNTDISRLAAMCRWVVSTDRNAVSSATEKTARLQKFKNEFEQHFVKTPMLYYYLFTEVFLMVDSRAKNFFPSTFDGVHWLPLPYDFDTAIGINNEGQLVFDYDLEDTDQVGGSDVFNGQNSVLWRNIRDAFGDELKAMYNTLRSGGVFSYVETVRRFAEHQSVWPEAVWNEDSWGKYLEPLEHDGDGAYLTMLQGSKASQREWWLFNGFRYRDSKYQCGDASSSFITLRCYNVGDITVTPYSHIWPRIKYGSATVTQRGKRNVPVTLPCALDNMNDTEVYIYSADRLAAIGDLSPLQVGYANFSMASKLQSLKLGDGGANYHNTRLTELYVGNNELLTSLDVRNCSALAMTVDLSGCVGVESILAAGSSVTGFALPNGGKLRTLELPATVTNLTIQNQSQFTQLNMSGYAALTTLRIENTPNVPLKAILTGAANLDRVRLIGVEVSLGSQTELRTIITKLENCKGLDASGNNTNLAVVTGRVLVPSVSADLLAEINDNFPQLVVVANGVPQYMVRYLDWNGTLLYRAVVAEGGNAVDPVQAGYINAPVRTDTEDTGYVFRDFGTLPTNIHSNVTLTAQYDAAYRVQFMNGESVYATQWVKAGANTVNPSGTPTKTSTAQYSYTFVGWNRNPDKTTADSTALNAITAPRTLYAAYTSTVRTYTVRFYNGSTLLQTVQNVPYGNSATYTGDTPVKEGVDDPENYIFNGWSPSPSNIKGETSCYAAYNYIGLDETITDSWDEIIAACANGTYKIKYQIGDTKILSVGSEGNVQMKIIAMDADTLADGSGKAPISWLSEQLLPTSHRMNPDRVSNYKYESGPSWTQGSTTAYSWTSKNSYVANNVAKMSLKITAVADGAIKLGYNAGTTTTSYVGFTLKVNGETIVSSLVSSLTRYELAVTSGNTYTVEIEHTSKTASNSYTGTFRIDNEANSNTVANLNGLITVSDIVIENCTVRLFDYYSEGTGAIGGWEKSEMRTYLKETVKPLIPENVRNAIKTIQKNQPAYDTAGSSFTQTTQDDVWLPSYTEMFASSGTTNQPRYKDIFPDNESRKKSKIGSASASVWWLRSAYNYNFYAVRAGGSYYNAIAYTSYGVALGFCT